MIKNKNILHGINRSEVPHFKSGPPVIQGSHVPPFSLSILHINLWNSPNGEIDERHIWVLSAIQTNKKQNATNREDSE